LRNSPVYFLLLFGLLGMLTDCGGSGNGTNVPDTTTSGIGTQSQRLIAESATATPSGTYWSGTVSDISVNGIIANCGQSNFSEGYGCLPVVTTGAAITGTAQRGGYFQMWGDLSKLPNITATTINYASTAFPATAPSSSPSASSTAAATTTSGTFMSFSNAQDYSTSFVPYASNSVWNTPVSTHPTYLSSSAAIVAAQFPGGNNTQTIRANEAGVYDYSHPRYFASNADPVVALRCTLYCGAPDNGGVPATSHIPALARPALGSDAHIDVVQADGTEICAWGVTQPGANWATGQTLTALNIANCGSFSSGAGWLSNGPGPTAAGFALQAGIITAAELIAGQINHAIFITGQCAIGSQYPSEPGASTDQCTSGLGPPLGGREWYDVPCSTTQANSALRPWEKAILCAMNIYGGYMGDDVGGGSTFTGTGAGVESEEPWYAYQGPGYTSPFAPLAAQGWGTIHMLNVIGNQSGTRWVGADPWQPAGVNFAAHIHWLDPCSARGAC
jgi:hypothetical protein